MTRDEDGPVADGDGASDKARDDTGGRRLRTSRRGLFALGGAALGGAAVGGGAVGGITAMSASARGGAPANRVPFYGRNQAGIATPAQDRLAFATYDVTTTGTVAQRRAALQDLLRTWTAAAAAMTAGRTVPGDNTDGEAPPADTGEAYGLPAANLTITIGFGPSLFDDRFGLAGRRPAALADLPKLPRETLDPARSNGDIAIQACSDDPQVAFHAIRNLARLGRGTVVMRWSQLGFGRTSSTSASQQTPRNLLGFKDGTRNLHAEDADLMNRHVWVGPDTDQAWMRDGSYLVTRRISMLIESWDRDRLSDQQNVIGRQKYSGAPLSGAKEFDTPDFGMKDASNQPVIPVDSHVHLAAHENNNGIRILRRGYSYTDGMITETGELDAGLFFIAYQRDAHKQFVPLQQKLGENDALNEYIKHVGSGLFACPPGVPSAGHYWGEGLFA